MTVFLSSFIRIVDCWIYFVCVYKISFMYVLILCMLLNKNCLFVWINIFLCLLKWKEIQFSLCLLHIMLVNSIRIQNLEEKYCKPNHFPIILKICFFSVEEKHHLCIDFLFLFIMKFNRSWLYLQFCERSKVDENPFGSKSIIEKSK